MSNWRPCRPSDDSDDAGQPVPEPQDSGITTPVAFEPPYILEPQLQSQSPSMISPILQHDKKQFDSQAYHAEGSYTCSHLPTADVIQEDRLSDDWMANTNTPNLEPASDPPDIRENMALENRSHCLDYWLGTSNENVTNTHTDTAMYDVSPTQNHQVDGDIQVLDRKIDDLLGLAQNAETNIPENTPSQGMLRNINTWSTTTESSSTEHLNCNLGLLAPYDPVPDLEWPSSTDPELFTTPREFAIPAPIEPSATTLTRQSGRRMNPIPIQPRPAIPCGPSSTHMGPRSTGKVGQPSLNHSQAGARSSSIPSCGSLLIVEQLTQEFPLPNTRRTRRPYSKKTCLRCQEYKEKCTGGVPCHNCRNLWDKPRQRKCLLWTACFASDIRELNYQQELFLDMCDIVETSTSLQFGKKIVDTSYDVVDRRESLRDMLILTVELLLSSAFGLSKDDWSPWSDPVPFVFYAINTYPRYVAELTNVDQLQFLFLKSASLGPTLNRIYKRLQRIKTGESTRLHLDLVLQVELLLIAVREPVSQAADIAETAVSWFMGEETKRDHVGRNSLVEELKDAVMRKEDQRKHLVLYLDWLVNKYKGSTVCNRSKLMISKLQNLGHDWRPAGSSGRVTQMRVEEAEKVLA